MQSTYLAEFQAAYLEDSYFLGIMAEGCDLRIKMLLALAAHHPDYAEPLEGEQHCYRSGSILFERPVNIELRAKRPAILKDPNGTLDFGGFEMHRTNANQYLVETEWFEARLEAERVKVHLSRNASPQQWS